jgi:hypothetical protein
MSRQDQYNVTVTVGGTDLGTFDKMSGGAMDSEESKYHPGGMAPQISLGGRTMVDNITVSRLYKLDRDRQLIPALLAGVGKAEVTCNKQSLDINGHSFGSPITYTGILKRVGFPDVDSESNDAALFELEVTTDGSINA